MAVKRVRYDRCIFKGVDGKACKAKRLRDCPWAFCSRHETLKLVEMRAKMRDEEAERQRIPLAQAIFVAMCGSALLGMETDEEREWAEIAFHAAEKFLEVVKDRAVG